MDSGDAPRGTLVVIAEIPRSRFDRVGAFTLEPREGSLVTGPSAFVTPGRVPADLSPPTAMNIVRTFIPLLQPGGELSIPPDDWAALSRVLESRCGGQLHVRTMEERGFFFVGHTKGLPCYELLLEIPDGTNPSDALNGEFDDLLGTIVKRNIHVPHELQTT